MRSLLVDNHDSFTYNLFQYLAEVNGREPDVVVNDDPSFRLADLSRYDNVVLSPGPGTPHRAADIGLCRDVIRSASLPVLGVCLGHQAIALAYGATVERAPQARHGRTSPVLHTGTGLFRGLPLPFDAVRYHSLAASGLPDELEAVAWTVDGVVMALRHRELPLWGVQFHPESVCTEHGRELLRNFAGLTSEWWSGQTAGSRGRATPARSVANTPVNSSPSTSTWVIEAPAGSAATPAVPAVAAAAPAGRRLQVLVDQLPTRWSAEVAFDRIFRSGTHSFWLDSGRADSADGRFSIMGDAEGPLARIATADVASQTVSVRSAGGTEVVKSGLFDWLDRELAATEIDVPDLPFDFAMGWVGYLGYELKAQCGGTAAHSSPDPDAVLVFPGRALVFDQRTGTTYVLVLTDDDETTRPAARREVADLVAVLTALDGVSERTVPEKSRIADILDLRLRHDRAGYLRLIEAAQEKILDGETYEVCLTNVLAARGRMDCWAAYRLLRRQNPVPFGAFLRFGDLTALSTSPERFLRVDRERWVECRPIKGTRPRGGTAAQDRALRAELATSEKDRAENLMIVDLVRNDLNRHAEVSSVQVPRLFDVETYATAHQLVSTVRGRLREGRSAVDGVRAAFPGGSMTGAPKMRTMQIIDELEGGPRGMYSGAIGYFSLNGTVDLSIVIRTLVVSGERISYGVGGAVIALSDPAEEFEETAVKATPFLRLFGVEFPDRVENPERVELPDRDEIPERYDVDELDTEFRDQMVDRLR